MSFHNLRDFLKFDWNAFAKGKKFMLLSVDDWLDYQTKAVLGAKVETVITEEDDSVYRAPSDGSKPKGNLFEKVVFRVPVGKESFASLKRGDAVMPSGNVEARVWGDYGNNLSVTADGVKLATHAATPSHGAFAQPRPVSNQTPLKKSI